jgi:hypothetical protein
MKKDIIDRIDELFPFVVGAVAGGMAKRTPQGSQLATGRLKELYLKVVYHKEKDMMKAVDLVAKEEKLDRKWRKKLKKYVKKFS